MCYQAGEWADSWPPPPRPTAMRGIERGLRDVDRARRALGTLAHIEVGDIRDTDFGEADMVVILDALHYIDRPAQEMVLRRARAAIRSPSLLLRVGDAGGGLRFHASRWVDTMMLVARGHRPTKLHCRTIPDWSAALTSAGFTSRAIPMSARTFASVLLVATPR